MTQSPSGGAPVCYRHPSRETYVRCTRCDRPICPECMREASVGHQCPECVAEGRRTQRVARTAFGGTQAGRRGYLTLTLIAINVFMMVVSLASARGAGALGGQGFGGVFGGETPLHEWGALLPRTSATVDAQGQVTGVLAGVQGGEYYRLLTSMFLHYGLIHLLMNMWALFVLGRILEAALGPWRFLALYLVSGLGGSVAVYYFGSQHGLTAGASGAIFGLFAALVLVIRRLGGSLASVIPILVINLIITFGVPGISIAGHLGGFATGAAIAAGLTYAPKGARTPVQVGVIVGILVLLTALTVVHTATLAA